MLQLSLTLKEISETNITQFYGGTLSSIIVSEINEKGGIVTTEDFKWYRPVVTEPVAIDLDDYSTLYTNQIPSSGILVSFVMRIMKGNFY